MLTYVYPYLTCSMNVSYDVIGALFQVSKFMPSSKAQAARQRPKLLVAETCAQLKLKGHEIVNQPRVLLSAER
eukprot:5911153-Pleurochrysis_carterae.AAC.1